MKVPPDKIRVTIRLDADALRGFVQGKQEVLENTLRRIIRDELRRAG